LKTRRVTSVSQVGTDRIIELQFSDGLYRLYLEFYAGGNIVLTDGDLNVLALLRNVEEGAEHEKLRVGLQYNLSLRQNYGGIPDLTQERIREGLKKAVDRQKEQPVATGKKAKKQSKDALRKALAVSITECPPLLIDHALHVAEFDSTQKPEEVLENSGLMDRLVEVLRNARSISEDIVKPDQIKGYILTKPNPAAPKEDLEATEKSRHLYDDFHPFRPQQFENSETNFLEFEGFNKTVDEFFSSIEGQKLESKLHEREAHAKKKLDHARQEHEGRIGGLQKAQEMNFRKAEAILANVHRVEEAIAAVNGLVGQGMDWGEIARLIEREQEQGNAVAQLIKLPLKLYENTVTLLLDGSSWDHEDQEEDEGYETSSVSEEEIEDEEGPSAGRKKAPTSQLAVEPKLAIDINLGLSAWANSSEYFDEKKTAKNKEERTLEASGKALKNTERKVAADLKKGLKQEKEVLRPLRNHQWFEKFISFISSDGYLVLGGKDAQQNEIVYRKYLRKGDIYVHADLKGAAPMVIKNNPNTPDAPIPPSTLSQAGHMSICTSEAWDSKAVMSAWWVNADQVSKTGHTGEFLAPGLFNVTGKKEFLPPAQLIVGLAAMFELSEDSKARHQKHRINDPIDAAPTESVSEPSDMLKDSSIEQEVGSDSDEEFPDAKLASGSDDDFPDTRIEDSEDSDAESETAGHTNPLQRAEGAISADSDSEDGAATTPPPASRVSSKSKKLEGSEEGGYEDAGSVADSEQSQNTGRRHLSTKERRLLKKEHAPDEPPVTDLMSNADEENNGDNKVGSALSAELPLVTKGPGTVVSQVSKANKGPQPRGKRGKAKKLAAKYADQDEEDRALALRLLGAKSEQSVAETAAQDKRSREEEAAANKQRRREQHLRAQAVGKAAEEARHAASHSQENDTEDDEHLRASLLSLDAFTGRPLPGDTLLSAIPVCAPWSALSTYKYKAKLQPGSLKRGKAVKEILMKWDHAGKDARALDKTSKDVERIWPEEIELIRGWKEAEVVGCVAVSKVRVMMAGGRDGAGNGGGPGGAKKTKKTRGGRGSKKK
jgi:predicted ribosome quality control (RQC) complex YloA/Tae2 family protein